VNGDLHRLAAGVVVAGFDGTTLATDLTDALDEWPLAGVVLFARNVESLKQTRALTDAIRALYAADSPPILAVDQEGGSVARIRDGVEEIPSMMALAATGDTELATRAGEQVAFDLRRAGLNLDFAPVLDLALERMNTVIGTRSFGGNPERVAAFAGAFAKGMQRGGVVASYKHFPGHGSTALDSHLELPATDLDETTFRTRDLVPFARLLPSATAVMTAHVVVRSLDSEKPATLSRAILTDILRGEIGFDGVCFTDCMQMDAIAKTIGSATGAAEAIAAGADCVLISHDLAVARESIERVVRAVEDGTIPLERLQEAHTRVRRLRSSLSAPLPLGASPPHAGVGREIGRRAVTLLRGDPHTDAAGDVVVSFEGATVEGAQGARSDRASLRSEAPALLELCVPLEPTDADVDRVLAGIAGSRRRPILLLRRAHVYARQAAAAARLLRSFPNAIVVSAREPVDALLFENARTVLCIYGDDAPSIAGLADVLFGGIPVSGSLPGETAAAG
jgi:beta-N-acetylhexosaminidase